MEYMPTQNKVIKAMENSSKLYVQNDLNDLKEAVEQENEGLVVYLVCKHENLIMEV